jgi:hypothetical protein
MTLPLEIREWLILHRVYAKVLFINIGHMIRVESRWIADMLNGGLAPPGFFPPD